MSNDDLQRRLETLEAKNRTLRMTAIAAVVLALGVPAGVAWGGLSYVQSVAPTLTVGVDEIRARRFVVVNEERRSRGTLSAHGDEAELALGVADKGRVSVRALEDRGAIALAAPAGSRTALWARDGVAQVGLRDAASHDVLFGVYSSGEAWRQGLRMRGGGMETRLGADDESIELTATHRPSEAGTRVGARLHVDRGIGAGVDLSTWSGADVYRHAELVSPSVEARAGAALRLEQRGSSLTARIGGVPHIDLRRGSTEVWASPTPRGTPVDDEAELEAAPGPAAATPTTATSTAPTPTPTPAPTPAPGPLAAPAPMSTP